MKNFKFLALLMVALVSAGLVTSCASHKAAKMAAKAKHKHSHPASTNAPAATPPAAAPAPAPVLTKEQQLAELLAKYETNAITPAEYQSQRAGILAQP